MLLVISPLQGSGQEVESRYTNKNCIRRDKFLIKAIAIECNTNINRVTVEEVEALMTKCTTLILEQFEALTEEQYKVAQ